MKIKLETPVTPSWARAAQRAAEDRDAGRKPTRVTPRVWEVPSTDGLTVHRVVLASVVRLQATCDCEAGKRGWPCRHAAAAIDESIKIWSRA